MNCDYVIAKTRLTGKYYVKAGSWSDDKRFDSKDEAFDRATELQDRDEWDAQHDIDLA